MITKGFRKLGWHLWRYHGFDTDANHNLYQCLNCGSVIKSKYYMRVIWLTCFLASVLNFGLLYLPENHPPLINIFIILCGIQTPVIVSISIFKIEFGRYPRSCREEQDYQICQKILEG